MTHVSHHEADQLTTGYVCSACWGVLTSYLVEGGCIIKCSECGENTTGFVSRKYTERRILESQWQYFEARSTLREAIPWMFPHMKQTPQEILIELGY